jgi:hypothetical protein
MAVEGPGASTGFISPAGRTVSGFGIEGAAGAAGRSGGDSGRGRARSGEAPAAVDGAPVPPCPAVPSGADAEIASACVAGVPPAGLSEAT